MDIHDEETADELSGEGMIIIDGENVETVCYSLTLAPNPGSLVAEGSISGSERLMKKVKNAAAPKLALEDGPILRVHCQGGRDGLRWIRATAG
jgi:hypothetical protein